MAGHFPLKPVWVRPNLREQKLAETLKLKAFFFDGSVIVDEADLIGRFDERVTISIRDDRVPDLVKRFARFSRPLGADDLTVLAELAESYRRRVANPRGPLKVPTKI